SSQHADGSADQYPDERHDDAAVDGIQDSAATTGRWSVLREQRYGHSGEAAGDQGPQDCAEEEQTHRGSEPGQAQGNDVGDFTNEAPVHTDESARRSSRSSMKRAAAMTVKVMRNNSAPSAINDEVYRSPTASVNSLAMEAEMVVPGASNEGLIRCALP